MDELLSLFLQFKSPHTRRAYETVISQFEEYLNKPLRDAKIPDVLGYLGGLEGKAQATVRHRYNLLKAYYEYLVSVEACSKNPVAGCRAAIAGRRIAQVRPTKFIPAETILKLLNLPDLSDRAGVRDSALLHILAGAGLRKSEAQQLNVGDILISSKGTPYLRLVRTKGGQPQQRTLPWWAYQACRELLAQRKKDGAKESDPLFVNYRGYGGVTGRIHIRTLDRIVKHYLAEVGIEAGCHSLRATFASQMLKNGEDSWDVARALGHSSTRMVDVYDKRSHGPDDSPVKKFKYEP